MKKSMNKNLLVTRGVICFPRVRKEIDIARPMSIKAINEAYDKNKEIIITAQMNPKLDQIGRVNEIYNVGVLAKIEKIVKQSNEMIVSVLPISRVLINNISLVKNSLYVDYAIINDSQLYVKNSDSKHFATLLELLMRYDPKIAANIKMFIAENEKLKQNVDIVDIVYQIADILPIHFDQKQQILALNTLDLKIDALCSVLSNPNDMSMVDKSINRKMNETLSKQQKEFYLREKLRTIKEELGEISSKENDADKFRKKLHSNPYPKNVKEKIEHEINHLESSNPQEASMIRTYIE
jgi:ATP-dependent Lon protease